MTTVLVSFVVAVAASIAAAGILYLKGRARYRLRFRAVLRLIEDLGAQVRRDGFQFDHLVAIGRNSGVVGSILAGQFGLDAVVAITLEKERSVEGSRTIALDEISERIVETLGGTRILTVICCNDSGASLAYVKARLEQINPAPVDVRTAALYTSPSPAFMPRYKAVVLDRDSHQSMTRILRNLPWVTQSWLHPFADERGLYD